MYRTFHSTAEIYPFFSNVHETFCRIDHWMDHKQQLSKSSNIEIMQSMVSDQNGMKLKISNRRKFGRFTNMWKSNTLIND